ncbi:hypothetical protein OROHE_015150 [Orobanche hederae]
MATSFSSPTLLLLISLSFTTTCLFLPITNASPVDDVCRQTKYPSLCLRALGYHKTEDQNLPNLGQVGLETMLLDIIGCQNIFRTLANATDPSPVPKLRTLYGQCHKLYQHAYESLFLPADDAAEKAQWGQVIWKISLIPRDVDQCEKLFTGGSPAQKGSHEVKADAEAILVIAKILFHKNV